MVPVLWDVCCNLYVVWRVVLCSEWLQKDPMVCVGFRWDKGVCALGVDLCESGGFAELVQGRVV